MKTGSGCGDFPFCYIIVDKERTQVVLNLDTGPNRCLY